jgi:hypothetical protein
MPPGGIDNIIESKRGQEREPASACKYIVHCLLQRSATVAARAAAARRLTTPLCRMAKNGRLVPPRTDGLALSAMLHCSAAANAAGMQPGRHFTRNKTGKGGRLMVHRNIVAKARSSHRSVHPVEAGVRYCQGRWETLDARFRGVTGQRNRRDEARFAAVSVWRQHETAIGAPSS